MSADDHAPPDITRRAPIGVVIVSYRSADVIAECLESLFGSRDVTIHAVVVDNCSPDASVQTVSDWAVGRKPFEWRADCPLSDRREVVKPVALRTRTADEAARPVTPGVTLIESHVNGGFAHAVNLGLRALMATPDIDAFWILNPDCIVAPDTAARYLADAARAPYALLGSRTVYYERPDHIQTDGGRISRRTATCSSVHQGLSPEATPLPDPASLDYISGANMVASRAFVDAVGSMEEDYFLYYEEVDWAMRRGNLPLRMVPDAIVFHHGGTTIGSGSTSRRPSAFANYFNYRNRMRFARRHMPKAVPLVAAKAVAKAAQLAMARAGDEAGAVLAGTFGRPPTPEIAGRIDDASARRIAFGRSK